MVQDNDEIFHGTLLDEAVTFTVTEFCQICDIHPEIVDVFVAHGVIEPATNSTTSVLFSGIAVRRVRKALRLHRDLGINLAGVALVFELLDEIEQLQRELNRLT